MTTTDLILEDATLPLAEQTDDDGNPLYLNGKAAAEEAGVTYRRLDWWVRTGVIACLNDGPGSGRGRLIPRTEIPVIRLMGQLSDAGIAEAPVFGRCARDLIDHGTTQLGAFTLTGPPQDQP